MHTNEDYQIDFLKEGLKITAYTDEVKEVMHSEEFKERVNKIIAEFRETKKNKKD